MLIYVVGVEFHGDMSELQNAAHQIALDRARTHVSIREIETEARKMLSLESPGVPFAGDDVSDVIEEFYPEQAIAALNASAGSSAAAEPEPQRARDIEDEVVDEETGEIIDAEHIARAARTAADRGEEALQEFCRRLSDPEYKSIAHLVAHEDSELRKVAIAALQDSPAGTNGNGADDHKQKERADGGRGSVARAPEAQPPAGDKDLLGDRPASDCRVRLSDTPTSDDWAGWCTAMIAMAEGPDPNAEIIRQNRENLAIFEQVDRVAHYELMRMLRGADD